ncbi:MAG: 1,4-beta-D-glucan glucohydrolase, partial [Novosphingobium sp. 16-62-11]
KRDFTGTLSFDWPQDARAPMIDPLFKVGHGLSYAKPAKVGPVNEDPRVDIGTALSETTYIRAGRVLEPWRLGLDSVVTTRTVDVSAQEDGRQFTWDGKGAFALDGPPIDVQRQMGGGYVLRLDLRLDARGNGPVSASFGGVALDISTLLPAAGATGMVRIPLTCFATHGAQMAAIGQPLRLGADKGMVMSIRNAVIEGVGEAIPCPPLSK